MQCNQLLQYQGAAYPRTCARCGLGKCEVIRELVESDLRKRAREIAAAPHAFASADVSAIINELMRKAAKTRAGWGVLGDEATAPIRILLALATLGIAEQIEGEDATTYRLTPKGAVMAAKLKG